jgi:hypothetical protein
VQAVCFGVGANGAFSAASFVHAAVRFGSVPPTGAQVSVYVRFGVWPWPLGQTVMLSDVEATRIAARTFTVPG